MENNTVKHRSLGKSIDQVRRDTAALASMVNKLYELDEDNYERINDIRSNIEKLYGRIDILKREISRRNTRAFLSYLMLGTGIYFTLKAIRSKIVDLEQRVEALENKKKES